MERMDQPEVRPNFDPMGTDPASRDQQGQVAGSGMAVDPVCGKQVNTGSAQYTATYEGPDGKWETFYFDTDECKQLFEREPERYAKLPYQQ